MMLAGNKRVIARNENTSVATLVERIDTDRAGNNLSSSIRLFVLNYFKTLSQISASQVTSDLTPSVHSQAR
jgi:predicted DNA-binding ribbon-helix-helix protein